MAVSFMKGEASKALAEKEAAAAKVRKESYGKLWRFSLDPGEDAKITFIDGDLDKDGNLVPIRYFEHHVKINGKWGNFFFCPQQTDPESGEVCPICAEGTYPAQLVAAFTIIDHRLEKSKDGKKEFKDQKRLLLAKPQTFEMLQKLAIKREGLAGVTFDVSRNNDSQSAAVGSMFDFDKKTPIAELQKLYMEDYTDPTTNVATKRTYFTPADYEQEITVRTGAELAKLGVGKTVAGTVQSPAGSGAGSPTDYSSKM